MTEELTRLTNNGYSLNKSFMDIDDLKETKKELTMQANVPPISPNPPTPFPIYVETQEELIVPRFYGFTEFGNPDTSELSSGITSSKRLQFKGDLRDYQKQITQTYIEHVTNKKNHGGQYGGGGLISVGCGQGKCLAKDTPVMLHNGSIALVQNIKVGDSLMGDNGTPRQVLSTTRGYETMVEIKQEYGITYTVNMSHIISLCSRHTGNKNDISVRDYINTIHKTLEDGYNSFTDEWQGYKPTLEFPYRELTTSIDFMAKRLVERAQYHISQPIFIPLEIKKNTRKIRLEFLASLMYYSNKIIGLPPYLLNIISYFDNISNTLGLDLLFIVYSTGTEMSASIDYIRASMNSPPTKKYTLTKLRINILKPDIYYGFEIDGNRRFLLGDGTVTHNTVMALNILCRLQKKTLVVVHKEFLMNQWIERIQQFIPDARIGKLQGKTVDVDKKDIVLGMLQSLSMKEYPETLFNQFGLTIIDECFPAYTRIITRNGIMTIEEIYRWWTKNSVNRSDELNVLSYNRYNDTYVWKPVTYAWEREKYQMITIHYQIIDETIQYCCFTCTNNHKILIERHKGYTEYVPAYKLEQNDKLVGGLLKHPKHVDMIVSFTVPYNRKQKVYDIEVEDTHNFMIVPKETLKTPQHAVVVSNCHHIGAEVFSRALFKMVTPYMLGLSATLQRKDGLSKVFKYFIGDVVYEQKQQEKHNVLVRAIQFQTTNEIFNRVEYNFRGQMNYAIMIRKLCESTKRTEFILDVVYDLIQENSNHQIMVLAHNKSLLHYLHDAIDKR